MTTFDEFRKPFPASITHYKEPFTGVPGLCKKGEKQQFPIQKPRDFEELMKGPQIGPSGGRWMERRAPPYALTDCWLIGVTLKKVRVTSVCFWTGYEYPSLPAYIVKKCEFACYAYYIFTFEKNTMLIEFYF